MTNRPAHRISRAGIAHVPEGRGILGELTVEENLRLGAYGRRAGDLDRAFTLFPQLVARRNHRASMLSGGEQPMLAIARSLLAGPRLLLIDELSLGLAPIITRQLLAALAGLVHEGLGVLVVEQNVHETLLVADRAYVMVNGRIVFADRVATLGSAEDVMKLYLGGDRITAPLCAGDT